MTLQSLHRGCGPVSGGRDEVVVKHCVEHREAAAVGRRYDLDVHRHDDYRNYQQKGKTNFIFFRHLRRSPFHSLS